MSHQKQWCEYAGTQTQGFSHPMGSPKIDELKPIRHKEFNEFINGRGLREKNNYALKPKFGFKSLKVERRAFVVSMEGIEPTMFSSMREATKAFSMGEGVIRYVRSNGRGFMRRLEGGSIWVFSMKWC